MKQMTNQEAMASLENLKLGITTFFTMYVRKMIPLGVLERARAIIDQYLEPLFRSNK